MKHSTYRTICRCVAVLLCALIAAGTGLAAEKAKAPAPAKKAAAEKKPAKTKAETKSKSKSKKSAKPAPAKKPVDETPSAANLPWSLRGQYGIAYGDLSLLYSTDNAEWCLVRNKTDVLLDNVGMTITLGDGSVVNVVDFTRGTTDFKDIKDNTGDYRHFWVQMAPRNGLSVLHWVNRNNDKPYLTIASEIKNVSDKPITIREVAPAVLKNKGLAISPDASVVLRPIVRRGGYVLYDPKSPQFAVFTDNAKKLMLGIGLLPESPAQGAIAFQKAAAGWQGKIAVDYGPGHVLKPGETLKVEPLMLAFFMPKASDLDIGYAMALSSLPKSARPAPSAWISAGAGDPAANVLAAAQAWSGSGVKHVLVPAPFSGTKGYPYDAKQMASDLKGLKMTPGIALDPLAVQDAPENLSVAGPDKRRWLNPTLPEARDYAVSQLKPLADWGYDFFVVAPSQIPNEALAAIGLSRAEADALACDIATAAAGDRAVLPAPLATLGNDLNAWLEADAATARLSLHDVAVGPVRIDAAQLGDPSDGLAMAIAMYPGSIELVGTPSKRAASLFPRPATFAQPVDCAQQAPKLWQAQEKRSRGEATNMVVAFPGAPAWTEADLPAVFKGKLKSLKVEPDGSMKPAK
jgi:hypothetical protein